MSLSRRRAFLLAPKKPSSDPTNNAVATQNRSSSEIDDDADSDSDDRWSRMLPELLTDVIRRVEASDASWPHRRSIVACGCVCKRWREVLLDIVRPPVETGRITFPMSLKQPGPRELPMQCFIKRNKKSSTFYLYLCLNQVSFAATMDKGKFLMAARRTRHNGHIEYILSLDADVISQKSNAYVGKLRADFLGTNFTIYDSQPPSSRVAKAPSSRVSRRFSSKQISPQVPAGNYEIGQVSYKFNLLKSRGPRRMNCSIQCLLTQEDTSEDSKSKAMFDSVGSTMILKNKAPQWHEHLQCWCLNFHGRVTVASVKNFQLVATVDPSQQGNFGDEETVLLQFGKVGDDIFTMDYRQPLSAFQAFAICLASFGTKFACE